MAKAKSKKNEAPVKAEKPTAAPKAKKADSKPNAAGNGKKAAGKSATALQVVTTVKDEDIARVAYAIWERKGRPTGQDATNWEEAKRELKVK